MNVSEKVIDLASYERPAPAKVKDRESTPETDQEKWPFIPRQLDDYGLLPTEFRIYGRVARRAGVTEKKKNGVCNEKLKNIAKACHVTPTTARCALRVLTRCGMLTRERRKSETDLYRPTPVACWANKASLKAIRQAARAEVLGRKDDQRGQKDRSKKSRESRSEVVLKRDLTQYQKATPEPYQKEVHEGIPLSEGNPFKGVCESQTRGLRKLQHDQLHTHETVDSKEQKNNLAVARYREICRPHRVNNLQIELITETVNNLEVWEQVLIAFAVEGQNPGRVDYLIERYQNADAPPEVDEMSPAQSGDPDKPMKTIKERIDGGELVSPGQTRQRSESPSSYHSALVAPPKPHDYYEKQHAEFAAQSPALTAPEMERARQAIREHLFQQTGTWPPESATIEELMSR